VSESLNVSPLEVWMVVALVGLVLQMAGSRRWTLVRGRLFWPCMAFAAFLCVGLAIGLSRGGDMKIALSEARAMFYVPLLYVLATNLMKRRADYLRMYRLAMVAIVINALLGIRHVALLDATERANPEALMQHSTALVMNLIVVWLLALRLMHGGSRMLRFALLLGAVPTMVAYLMVKRRAAIVGLAAAALLLFLVLFFTNRKRFLKLLPVLAIASVGYLGAFWNSTSTLGFPAQAMKTVIAPGQLSQRDQDSNYYRVVETFDIRYTIRSSPVTGIGFGKPFLRPIPLPRIADFALEEYVTHNSMLWVWMKLGFFGFVAMIYLFGTALHEGVRAVRRDLRGDYAALTVTSLSYVLMYGVYTYVDIAWDTKTMVLLAVAFAQIDSGALLPREADEPARAGARPRARELAAAGA
jgi:O-antigen ligase